MMIFFIQLIIFGLIICILSAIPKSFTKKPKNQLRVVTLTGIGVSLLIFVFSTKQNFVQLFPIFFICSLCLGTFIRTFKQESKS